MTESIEQACPFCGSAAWFFYEDYANRKHFFCDDCTEFELSRYAENICAGASDDWRSTNAKAAKNAPAGSFYRLTRPTSERTDKSADLVGIYVKHKP